MLSSVLVEHNNSGYGAGWYLDQILIQELGKSDSQYVFSCQRWLDSGVGDGKMKQELRLLGKTNKESLTKDVHGKIYNKMLLSFCFDASLSFLVGSTENKDRFIRTISLMQTVYPCI